MYVITNRQILCDEKGLGKFGKRVNGKGPNELRLADVRRKGKGWNVEFLEDKLSPEEAGLLIAKHSLSLSAEDTHYASLKVACDVAAEARKRKTHILFFVHGFNNDMTDVVKRAEDLAARYGIIVIPFSWPANGGGVSGIASYKSDKRDARASAGGLERAMQKVGDYLQLITEARRKELWDAAQDRHADNPEARDSLYSKLLEKDCPYTVNALFHSMGNYLLKHMLKSSIAEGAGLTFDNVLLVAADTNNKDHDTWVGRIRFRRRCFVTINENDHALAASRAKSGSDQLARLGHYLRGLDAGNAHYVNFTDAPWVRESHAYFGDPAQKNDQVHRFFNRALKGGNAEEGLRYHAEGNWFGF